jgi:cytosine/adenosine deaminase-related metal-dependent hydrolase
MATPGGILIATRAVVCMDEARTVVHGGRILVRDGRIERVLAQGEADPPGDGAVERVDARTLIALPGFVHTHIHLCQTLFRGLADGLELLDWLRLRIFPFEAAHTARSMEASAMLGIAELIRSGATTIMDMGSVHHEEEVVRALQATGLRACVGKSLIDINDLHPPLKEPTADALRSAENEIRLWHGSSEGRIRYAVAPRFVLSCSDELLRGAQALVDSSPGVLLHTHAAENRREMDAVRSRFGSGNIECLASLGLLHPTTCLAHCIWLDDAEIALLAERRAKVLHCPSSNLKLGSGVAPVPALLRRGISVSLGADGAPCNNSLDMFTEMRLAALIQNPVHGPGALDAPAALAMATREGARALGLGEVTGTIEPGKRADIQLLDLHSVTVPLELEEDAAIASAVVYSGSPDRVRAVMVDGRWLYREGRHLTLDAERVRRTAAEELKSLLRRCA